MVGGPHGEGGLGHRCLEWTLTGSVKTVAGRKEAGGDSHCIWMASTMAAVARTMPFIPSGEKSCKSHSDRTSVAGEGRGRWPAAGAANDQACAGLEGVEFMEPASIG
jgi:hypothetical protein